MARDVVRGVRAAVGRSERDLATAARMLKLVAGKVRDDRVRSVRHALAYGEYENAMKIEIAVDRLLDDLDLPD